MIFKNGDPLNFRSYANIYLFIFFLTVWGCNFSPVFTIIAGICQYIPWRSYNARSFIIEENPGKPVLTTGNSKPGPGKTIILCIGDVYILNDQPCFTII